MTIPHSQSASRGPGSPDVVGFYDPASGSCQYICIDPATKACALIDVVLDFNPARARTSTEAADWALDWMSTNFGKNDFPSLWYPVTGCTRVHASHASPPRMRHECLL